MATKYTENRRAQWKEWNGFNGNDTTFCICGNTYPIKDMLKEAGCKFNKLLFWHSPVEMTNLPEDCYQFEVKFDEMYYYIAESGWQPHERNTAASIIREHTNRVMPKKEVEICGSYLEGEVGQRVRNLQATLTAVHGFSSMYGYSFVYTFETSKGEKLTWITTKDLDMETDTVVDLTFTIKEFAEYRNERQTKITRAIVKLVDSYEE